MQIRLLFAAALALFGQPLGAQGNAIMVTAERPPSPDELILPPDHIIHVMIDGEPLRLLVTAEASGPVAIDPQLPVRRQWRAYNQTLWDYGDGDVLRAGWLWQQIDFGDRQRALQVMWSFGRATPLADGMIGIHHLPYKRIVMPLGPAVGEQQVQVFPLRTFGRSGGERVGVDIDAGGRRFKAVFATQYAENIITAPTADYLATRFDGGFLPGSEGKVRMRFGVERRTRIMRLARPLELGDLLIDHFAVRLEDHGKARNVGEARADDPRFVPNQIVVSRRKPRGNPDFLTRIGRNQIAHCSSLTYDREAGEISLSCGPKPE